MSTNRRLRLIMLVALMATMLFNFPFLTIIDGDTPSGIGTLGPALFIIWAVLILLCAVIVSGPRK